MTMKCADRKQNARIRPELVTVLLMCFLAVAVVAGCTREESENDGSRKQTQERVEEQGDKKKEENSSANEEPAPSQPRVWTKVLKLSGNAEKDGKMHTTDFGDVEFTRWIAMKQSDPFELTGGRVKLTYKIVGDSDVTGIAIWDKRDLEDPEAEVAEDLVDPDKPDAATILLTREAGQYVLDVSVEGSRDVIWTVTVEEER